MSKENWEVVYEVTGAIQAEILRGLLEAQGLQVILSQEGIGHDIYPVNFGALGRIQILVPVSDAALARQTLAEYQAGDFDQPEGSSDGS
jgi:hypothetical protein